MSTSPNILLIHSDQHRYDCLGINGHPFIETPNLDRLAAEGINFTHAFTPIPLCTPARNCLLHGQWSTEHGCIMNADSEAPGEPALWGGALVLAALAANFSAGLRTRASVPI